MITIKKPGAPTVDTIGLVGQHYINLVNGDEYECVKIDDKRVYEKNDVKANSFFSQKVLAGADCEYIWNLVKAGGGSGGSGGDWNQNDPNAPGYIKNRPFYDGVLKAVLETQTIEGFVELGNGVYNTVAKLSPGIDFVEGEYYVVTLDGAKYRTKAVSSDPDTGGIAFGNEHLRDSEMPDTGEHFWIDYRLDVGLAMICIDGAGTSHSIGIYREVPKKIDPKYIPDPGKAKVIFTVDENGNTSVDTDVEDLYTYLMECFQNNKVPDCIYKNSWEVVPITRLQYDNLEGVVFCYFAMYPQFDYTADRFLVCRDMDEIGHEQC